MQTRIVDNLSTITPGDWNTLVGPGGEPFLRHEFLSALEEHGCVGPHWGWRPRHLLLYERQMLIGAVPLYLKDNSYGELVFDWSWADAYRRAGLDYYPKLVSAIPYTPATGPRLLVAADTDPEAARAALFEGVNELAEASGVSSVHWLFPEREQARWLERQGLALRVDCQFHWHNRGYRDFDDFLATFTAEKRKKLRRERRRVAEAGIEIEVLHGDEANEEQWEIFHRFYVSTFDRRGGYATLHLEFFPALARRMPESLVLVLARHAGRYVAGALNLRGGDTLYGRHWGCEEAFHSLHFEACYYTGIDYCIRNGLAHFEPGAQGEHKVARGFVPTPIWSAHWIANPAFSGAIADFTRRERRAMEEYMAEVNQHLPYRAGEQA